MEREKYPFLLSIITDEISQNPEEAITLAAQYHFDGIELRSAWDQPVELLPEERLRALVDSARQHGLAVSAIASSFLKEDWGKDDRSKFDRLVKACRICGCTTVRAFSFWKSDDYSDEAFAAYLADYDRLLVEEGLTMTLENDPSVNLSTGIDLGRFFSRFAFGQIGILWDPGNDLYTCGGKIVPYPDAYASVRPYVKHVHVKDAVTDGTTGKGVAVGDGEMDFAGQFRALRADGYSGWITLEPHYRLEGEIDEALLRRPGGAAFSKDGYLPSKICMENLHKILDRLLE